MPETPLRRIVLALYIFNAPASSELNSFESRVLLTAEDSFIQLSSTSLGCNNGDTGATVAPSG